MAGMESSTIMANMQNSPVMNAYRYRDFPLTLYRVQYPGSHTLTCDCCGCLYAASTFTPRRVNGLRNAVQNHLIWRAPMASPFISAFSNLQHAGNWAEDWSNRHDKQPCCIMEIKIEEDDNVIVFRVNDLVNRLGITTSRPSSEYRSEYLCFYRIPPQTIQLVAWLNHPDAMQEDSDDGSH